MKMVIDDLYVSFYERLKLLGVSLNNRNTCGVDGIYKGKHITRVQKIENRGVQIDVRKSDGKWRGWEPVYENQMLDKVFDDYIKPMIELDKALDKAKNSTSEIEKLARNIGNALNFQVVLKIMLKPPMEQLEIELQTLKEAISTLNIFCNSLLSLY
jgi:hypothetical protein